MKRTVRSIFIALLLALPATVDAQFTYITNADNTITVTGSTDGSGLSTVNIPAAINGLPVTRIGDYAFYSLYNLTSATIPNSVTSVV